MSMNTQKQPKLEDNKRENLEHLLDTLENNKFVNSINRIYIRLILIAIFVWLLMHHFYIAALFPFIIFAIRSAINQAVPKKYSIDILKSEDLEFIKGDPILSQSFNASITEDNKAFSGSFYFSALEYFYKTK